MAENVPPATTAAPATGGTAGTSGADQATRGIPYYEKLRRELRDTIQKKRLMDKNMAMLEDSIYRFEHSYLEETGAGNIIKGFDNYIKGSSGTSNLGSASGSGMGASFGAGGNAGGPNTRKRNQVSDVDKVFSRSSASFMRDSPAPSSANTTPTAPTPINSGPTGSNRDKEPVSATSTKDKNSKKNKKSGGGAAAARGGSRDRNDEEDDGGDSTKPSKRLKITYSRGD